MLLVRESSMKYTVIDISPFVDNEITQSYTLLPRLCTGVSHGYMEPPVSVINIQYRYSAARLRGEKAVACCK